MSTGQQVILAILLVLGNPILVSIFTLAFRKHIFEKRFRDIIRADRERMKQTGAVIGMAGAMFGLPVMSTFRSSNRSEPKSSYTSVKARSPPILGGMGSHLQEARAAQMAAMSPEIRVSLSSDPGPGVDLEASKSPLAARPSRTTGNTPQNALSPGGRSVTFLDPIHRGPARTTGLGIAHASPNHSGGQSHGSPHATHQKPTSSQENHTSQHPEGEQQGFNITSFLRENKAQIGRNGQFFNLTAQEREYLGGVEYRAIKLLMIAVTCYFVVFQVLGAITLGAWIAVHETSSTQLNAQNPWWTGIFLSISAFNNGGLCLLDAGIQAFLSSYFLLIVVICLMLTGSAAFPVFLRLGLWLLAQGLEYGTREMDYPVLKETLSFTLKYPRRVYTMLFPSKSTWYLVAMFVGLVAVDWVLILVLSIGNSILTSMPVGQRVFDVLFQSICAYGSILTFIYLRRTDNFLVQLSGPAASLPYRRLLSTSTSRFSGCSSCTWRRTRKP